MIAVATVAWLIVPWPGHVTSPTTQGISTDSERAHVDSVRESFCAGFQTQQCQFVRATIESGAEKGKRVVVQLSAGGLDPVSIRAGGLRWTCTREGGAAAAAAGRRRALRDLLGKGDSGGATVDVGVNRRRGPPPVSGLSPASM